MLVGRDREVAELEAALAAGRGGVFLLAGEPGIGKTRLAGEIAGRARDRGVRAVWGRCWEAGGAPALWPWREALEALGIAFPEAIAAGAPEEARFALFREIAAAIAGAAPLLIVLEDLHAADQSTLLLLERIAGALRDAPVLVVGTYRDLEASLRPDAADALARAGRTGRVLQLARLRAPEVTALVRDAIDGADDRLAATVFETTQGNPLFVAEIVRDVQAYGAIGEIPLGVREIIRQRLALVSPHARGVLEAAAVLGVELRAADVARVVPGAAAILDDAVRSGLVVARGDRLRFSHALYREALYHELPRARRQELHRAAADALAAAGAPPAETAHHLLESGPDAAAAAIDHAIRAAAQMVAVFAFEDAAALLERARAAIPPGPLEVELRCRILIALGETRLRGGDPTGRALCVEAAALARALGDAALVGRAGLAYGSVFLTGGVDPVLVSMLDEAYAALDPGTPLCALVMARLAAARQPGPERARDLQLARDAVALARRVAEPRDQLAVLHFATGTLYGAEEPALRLAISRDQERLAEELGDVARLVQARGRIAMDHLELADFASYAENAARYEEVAARVGPAAAPWRVPLMRSTIALAADRFDESERWQAEARRIEAGRPQARRTLAFHRIGFLRAAERHAELRAAIPELRDLWLQMPYGVHLAEARVASCLARIGAEDETRAALARLDAAELDEEINSTALAEAAWLTGDARIAARIRPHLARYADRWMPYWLEGEIVEGPGTRLLGYACALAGDWVAADREVARALAAIEVVGKRGLAARTRFELGDLMLRAGREPARARLEIAAARAGASEVGLPELVALIDRRHAVASTPAPRRFALVEEGEYVAIETARGTLRFKASRGMQYLARLVARPGVDVHVLDLAGAGEGVDRGDAGELLDAPAMRAYRARLEALRDRAEDAEARGDADAAERARDEMEAIAAELSRGTARGGAARRSTSAVDRARSAVQRRLKDAIDRIAEQDADLGAWLRRVVTTGNHCMFRPDP